MKIMSIKKASVSFSKGNNETSMRHNNRDLTDKEKENDYHKHINFAETKNNKTLVKKDIKEVYEELFGEALQQYNAKQKRKDRRIKNYYSKILKDKKMDTQKEFIVQIGKKEDFEENKIDGLWNISNEILEKYVNSFEKRNPNLKIYNAIIHNDESSPHLHLNVVPVAKGYKNGLQKQPSFDKALRQQDDLETKGSSFDLFKSFRNQEAECLEALLKEYSIDRELVGTNNIKNHHEYKDLKEELSGLQTNVESLEKEKEDISEEIEFLENKREELADEVSATQSEEVKEFISPEVKIPVKKYAVISRENFEKFQEQNELIPQLVKQNKNLKKENEMLEEENQALISEIDSQSEQIIEIRFLLETARKQFDKVVQGGADLWNRTFTYVSNFYPKTKTVIPEDMQNEPSGEQDYQDWRRRAAMHQRER